MEQKDQTPNAGQFLTWSEDMYRFVMDMMDFMKRPHDYGTGLTLNMVEIHTLVMIDENPGISVGEVGRRWNRSKSAASRNIDRLCGKGVVEKRKENNNGKDVHLYPTEKGKQLASLHRSFDRQQTENFVSYIADKCQADEIETFHRVMEIIHDYYRE